MVVSRKNLGLDRRIEAFFAANPDEELTYADIVLKFDTCLKSAQNAVMRLRQTGAVESVHIIRAPSKGRA